MIIYIPMIQALTSPCWPAPVLAPCIRLCSAASPRTRLAVRINDAKPKVIITASCGIEVGRVIDYKPLLDGAIALPITSRRTPSSSSDRRSRAH